MTSPGKPLPDSLRLGTVRLQVADMGRSLAYYTEVLGLALLSRADPHAVLGAADGTPLVELFEQRSAAPVPPRGRLGLFHFAILLPDRSALGRFVAHLATHGIHAGASDHLVSEALYLNDPDGLGIEVYADRPRASWQRQGDEIAMATLPLDLAELMQAAGGVPWDGMPAGTVVGHVHLHVGDLARAAAFYHDALGLDIVVKSYPGALFLSAGGYHHHLGLNTWARGAEPAHEADARLLEWQIMLPADAVPAVLRRFEERAHAVERGDDGGRVRDPWGTVLRVRSG